MIIYDTIGDGLHLSSARRDATEISGTAVENYVQRVDVRGAGGWGIRVYDPTAASQTVTDGWIKDCIVRDPIEDGIRVDCSAGWLVSGSHVYGAAKHGIHMGRADSTRVVDNYVETFGFSGTIGWYAAIAMGDGSTFIGSTNPSIVAGNTAFYAGGATPGGGIYGIIVNTSNSVTSHVSITGNGLYGSGTCGIDLTNQGGTSTTYATVSGNIVRGWTSRTAYNANGGGMHVTGDMLQAIATTATEGFARVPSCAGTPTGTPASLTEGSPVVWDSANNILYVYSGGSWHAIS